MGLLHPLIQLLIRVFIGYGIIMCRITDSGIFRSFEIKGIRHFIFEIIPCIPCTVRIICSILTVPVAKVNFIIMDNDPL